MKLVQQLASRGLVQAARGDVLPPLPKFIRDRAKGNELPPLPDHHPGPALERRTNLLGSFPTHFLELEVDVGICSSSLWLPRPIATPAPVPPVRDRSPSPDVLLIVYSHTRHPLDLRTHLTILPSWAIKAEKETQGEYIICYGEDNHLQIRCKQCQIMKVCCRCVVGIYQSFNPCPVYRFRGGGILDTAC